MSLKLIYEYGFYDENGLPYDGGKLYAYNYSTGKSENTYSDENGTINDYPISLDARGCAKVFIDEDKKYRFELYTSDGELVFKHQPVTATKNGADGADGVSCTHYWVGTTLYVTSASGESHADLKGEKGDKGEHGDDGADGKNGVDGINGRDGDTWLPYFSDGKLCWKLGNQGQTPSPMYIKGESGENGADGKTWRPSVDSSGNISFTISSDETAPSVVNIKGERGEKGEKGDTGSGLEFNFVIETYYALSNILTPSANNVALVIEDESVTPVRKGAIYAFSLKNNIWGWNYIGQIGSSGSVNSISMNATKLTVTNSDTTQKSCDIPTFNQDTTGNAATATKATQDKNGNDIVDTYATKTALSDGLGSKQDSSTAVKTSTNQDIEGIKTFKSNVVTNAGVDDYGDVNFKTANKSGYTRLYADAVNSGRVDVKLPTSSGTLARTTDTVEGAKKDKNGKDIVDTYATKTEMNGKDFVKFHEAPSGWDGDWNGITIDSDNKQEFAMYHLEGSNFTNSPDGNANGIWRVLVHKNWGSLITQEAQKRDHPDFKYIRTKNNATWSSWRKYSLETTDTYSSTGTCNVSGKAVSSAISTKQDSLPTEGGKYSISINGSSTSSAKSSSLVENNFTSGSLNDLKCSANEYKVYQVSGGSVTDRPDGVSNCIVECCWYGSTNGTLQTLHSIKYEGASTIYQRFFDTNGWSAWTRVALDTDIPSGVELTENKVTSVSSSSTDVQYPSAKCVNDLNDGCVHKSGNETINGTKTFNESIKLKKNIDLEKNQSIVWYGTNGKCVYINCSPDDDATKDLRIDIPNKAGTLATTDDVSDHHDSTKQDTLTFDLTPTSNSNNPVTSGGIKSALDGKQNSLSAGININISGSTISATDTTYSEISDTDVTLIKSNIDALFA